jgi:Domain of unknown function (DUF4440)
MFRLHASVTIVRFLSRVLFILLLLVLRAAESKGQGLEDIKSQAELDKVMTSLDAALFDSFNRCDVQKFSSFFADDVEFYHDQAGASYGTQKLIEDLKKNICSGDVRREVVGGSLEAHHMKNFGAVQIGRHRFYHPKSNERPGEARFIHLWRYKDGAWKITRVISYDHRVAK